MSDVEQIKVDNESRANCRLWAMQHAINLETINNEGNFSLSRAIEGAKRIETYLETGK